jgi:hypothetical protein
MKRAIVTLLAVFTVFIGFSQTATPNDKIYKHSGEVIQLKIIKVGEGVITFKYPNEDAEQTIGKLAVDRIEYGSGRIEKISDKIVVNGKDDWEKVQMVTDENIILGLRKGEELTGKTSGWVNYNTQAGADNKATKHIKESAAELNAPYILITADKNSSNWRGVSQGLKKGVAYTYN